MYPLYAREAPQLLEAARGDRLKALFGLAVHTGMRRGELLGLKWEDVDLDIGKIRVRRTLTSAEKSVKPSEKSRHCHNRRMAKDYERLSATGEAFVHAAMTRLMVRRLARA